MLRDAEQPGGKRRSPKPEPADRLEHLHERLRRQVLRVVTVADAHVQVAVDAVEVDEVQLFERVTVALLTALDESAYVVSVRRLGTRRLAFARCSHQPLDARVTRPRTPPWPRGGTCAGRRPCGDSRRTARPRRRG